MLYYDPLFEEELRVTELLREGEADLVAPLLLDTDLLGVDTEREDLGDEVLIERLVALLELDLGAVVALEERLVALLEERFDVALEVRLVALLLEAFLVLVFPERALLTPLEEFPLTEVPTRLEVLADEVLTAAARALTLLFIIVLLIVLPCGL